MEPPRTDGVGGVGCPPCMRDGDGSVFLPFSSPCKKETVAARGGGPEEPSMSGPWEGWRGLRGGLGGAALRLAIAGGAVG